LGALKGDVRDIRMAHFSPRRRSAIQTDVIVSYPEPCFAAKYSFLSTTIAADKKDNVRLRRSTVHKPDNRHRRLLRSFRERPCRRASNKRYEIASCLRRGLGRGIVAAQARTRKGPEIGRCASQKQTFVTQKSMSA